MVDLKNGKIKWMIHIYYKELLIVNNNKKLVNYDSFGDTMIY